MSMRYGGIVYGLDGKQYDWGQALMRECLGPDWIRLSIEQGEDMPTKEQVKRALDWEDGQWPEWVDVERTQTQQRFGLH